MDKNKLLFSLLAAVLGFLMFVIPETFLQIIVIILGVAAVVDGIFILLTTRNIIINSQYKTVMTLRGILSVLVGALAIIFPTFILKSAWNIIAYILAGYLLVSSAMEIYCITKLYRNGIMIRQSVMEVVISVILAIALFVIPAESIGTIIMRIVGAVIFVLGALTGFWQWHNRPLEGEATEISDTDDSEQQEEQVAPDATDTTE